MKNSEETTTRVGILQCKPIRGEVAANHKMIRKYLGRRKFDLAVLPELVTSGYNFERRADIWELAEDKRGPSFAFFADLASRTGGAIVWGFPERSGKKLFNSAALTTPEGDHHIYRKTHLFFREKEIFDPGDTGFKVFSWRGVKIGIMICYDWIYPEAARSLALGGSQIIVHPSNLVMHYCQDAMVTRSLENGVFCITTNRTGTEKIPDLSLTFTGRSQITGPKGERLLRFSRTDQGFKSVKIAPTASDTKNMNRYNNLFADRRIGRYSL